MCKRKLQIQTILLITVVAFGFASCVSLNSHRTVRTVGNRIETKFGTDFRKPFLVLVSDVAFSI